MGAVAFITLSNDMGQILGEVRKLLVVTLLFFFGFLYSFLYSFFFGFFNSFFDSFFDSFFYGFFYSFLYSFFNGFFYGFFYSVIKRFWFTIFNLIDLLLFFSLCSSINVNGNFSYSAT